MARAVGTLLLGAATHDLRGATRGAAAGCAPGVARMVDVSLARRVLEALPVPPREAHRGPEERRASLGLAGSRAQVPAPSWWCRESAWTPRVVTERAPAGREAAVPAPVAAVWPPLPDAPERPIPRPAPGRRTLVADQALEHQALRILESELQPVEWSMPKRPSVAPGGPR